MAIRIFKRLRELLDVDTSGVSDGDSLTYDAGSDLWVPAAVSGGGGSDDQTAAEVPFTPAGNIAAIDVQAALEELDTEKATPAQITSAISALSTVYQPLDSDLTAIAALTTTSFGRGLLALADAAALRTTAGLGTAATSNTGDFDAAGAAAAAQAASQPLDSDLTAIAALTTTSFGRGLLALADAAALRTSAGLVIGTDVQAHDADLDTYAGITPSANVQSLLGAANYAAMRTLLGLVIGTNVQAFDADLTTWAGLTPSAFFQTMVDDPDAATARATLGVIASLFQSGGAQAIKLDDLASPDDNTDLNASSGHHGLLPKLDGNAAHFLAGDGSWATPSGGGSVTKQVVIPLTVPDSSGNGYASLLSTSNIRELLAAFTKDVDGDWWGIVRVPQDYSSTPKIILRVLANATSGVTRLLVSSVCKTDSEVVDAALTAETAQDITVPGTAYTLKDVTFTLASGPAAGDTIVVKITHNGAHANDTLAVDTLLAEAVFQYAT